MSRRVTAYHEAGHATEAVLLGGASAVEFTTIDPKAHEDFIREHTLSWGMPLTGVGFTAFNLPYVPKKAGLSAWMPLLEIDLAGPVAERLCQRRGVRRPPTRWREDDDFERLLYAGDVLGRVRDGSTRFARSVWESTVARVRCDWDAIEAVAQALLARGTLAGAEVLQVVEAARGGGPATRRLL